MITEKQKQLLLEQLKKTPIVQIACEKTNISRATYYRWRKEDDGFAKLADEAVMEGALLVNDMAESQLISAIKDKNMRAITFWLQTHHKGYSSKVELNGKMEIDNKPLTPEQETLLRKALELSGLNNNTL